MSFLRTPVLTFAAVVAVVIGAVGASSATPQSVSSISFGELDYDNFAWSVARAGDVNQDGFPDAIVGIPFDDTSAHSAGSAVVVSGEWLVRTALGQAPQTPRFLYRWHGDPGFDTEFGTSVAGGGDVTGDGVPDLVVGAPGDDNGSSGSVSLEAGSVTVFSGATGYGLATFYGGGYKLQGTSVAIVGDVDGDGYADVAAGAVGSVTTSSPFPGYVRVYSGDWIARAGAGQPPATPALLYELRGDAPLDKLGQSVCGLGDLNGDGCDDFAVGAYRGGAQRGGYVRVYSGCDASTLVTIEAATAADHLGFSLANAGDVNGDGVTDLVAGAWAWDTPGAAQDEARGRAIVFSGEWIAQTAAGLPPLTPRELWVFAGDAAGDRFGQAVGGGGDFDGDGYADVVVGARQLEGTGYARVHSGQNGVVLHEERGRGMRDQLGFAVAGGLDLDGDGLDEVLFGAPQASPPDPSLPPVSKGELRVVLARGRAHCFANANSTGLPARLHASGSPSVAQGELELRAEPVPPGTLGVFFASDLTQPPAPFFDGYLCVAAASVRRIASASSGSGTLLARDVDLASWGLASIDPGERWVFQCLFRDPAGGATGWNLSDGLSVTFEP